MQDACDAPQNDARYVALPPSAAVLWPVPAQTPIPLWDIYHIERNCGYVRSRAFGERHGATGSRVTWSDYVTDAEGREGGGEEGLGGPRRLASVPSSHARSHSHEVRRCLVLGAWCRVLGAWCVGRGVAWRGKGGCEPRRLNDLRRTSSGEKRPIGHRGAGGRSCGLHRPHPKLKCTMIQDSRIVRSRITQASRQAGVGVSRRGCRRRRSRMRGAWGAGRGTAELIFTAPLEL